MPPKFERTDPVKAGRYTFSVHSIETHWAGEGSGKMEDMPGDFLDQTVNLTACDNPSPIEQLGVQHQVQLYHKRKEITGEFRRYSELKHEQLVDFVSTSPEQYAKNIRAAVKGKL